MKASSKISVPSSQQQLTSVNITTLFTAHKASKKIDVVCIISDPLSSALSLMSFIGKSCLP